MTISFIYSVICYSYVTNKTFLVKKFQDAVNISKIHKKIN